MKLRVAIIGAGAIGLYLGWKLSQKGHKVVVFEKNERIGQKACSCLISERIKKFVDLPDSAIEKKVNRCLIHFPKRTIRLGFKPIHYAVKREVLDNILYKKVLKAGAEIRFGEKIKAAPCGFDRVVGCDGALSSIRSSLNLEKPFFRLGIQAFCFPQKESFQKDEVEAWPIEKGFCWKIPRRSCLEYGAIGKIESVSGFFGRLCEESGIRNKIYETKTALVPQGLILPESERITLCGDSAGLTKPWSGGGIIWGLTAADILLKNFPSFKGYRKEAKRFFAPRMIKGSVINSLVFFFGSKAPFLLPSFVSRDNDFPVL